jgi:rubredoxin
MLLSTSYDRVSDLLSGNFIGQNYPDIGQTSNGEMHLDKWICKTCLYLYDPEVGDPGEDIAPCTTFESIMLDYSCPVCGAPGSQFEKLSRYERNIFA